LDEPTIAERLRPLGYATGLIGKWHVGYRPELQPPARGFDVFYGILSGAGAYLRDAPRAEGTRLLRGSAIEPMPEHMTSALGDEARTFIEANRDRPFLLIVSFTAVHAPLQSTPAYVARFSHVEDLRRRTHLAQLAAMDDAVGEVIGALRREGLEHRTLVMFTSDNGGPTRQTTSSNAPFRGEKGSLYEGGVRVPTFLAWPGQIAPRSAYDGLTAGFDLAATALAVAGADAEGPALDGVNLMPFIQHRIRGDAHEHLFWRSGANSSVREDRWKLILGRGGTLELYDLVADPGETHNLADTHPEEVARLRAAFQHWSSSMSPPRWRRAERSRDDD
jgi:arylsulfatase A-like enzyme